MLCQQADQIYNVQAYKTFSYFFLIHFNLDENSPNS